MTMDRHRSPDPIWLPVVAPTIWTLHFAACYLWAVVSCGRVGPIEPFASLRTAVAAATAAALVPITILLLHGFRRHGYRWPDQPNDAATPGDRTRFMAFTTVLLAGLSWIATLFVGAAAWSIGGCR